MTAIAHAISIALLHFVWEGLAVGSLLWVALAVLRNSSARLRYALSCIALAIMTALPLITAGIVYAPDARTARGAHGIVQVAGSGATGVLPFALLPRWMAAIEPWTLPVWSAGVLIFAIRLGLSSRHVLRLRRDGKPAGIPLAESVARLASRMNIGRPVRVLMSGLIDSPSVVGLLRPAILVPAAALLNLSTPQLEAVIAHELAHIRRRDYLVNLLQSIAETLLFYQPAIWWVSSRIRRERELCCDDLAVEICGDPVGYARALTRLERARAVAPELVMTSATGPLMHRIRRLTGAAEPPPSKAPAALAILLALVCLMTNVRWAEAQPQTAGEAEVRRTEIWLDTVKYGDLPVDIRALGHLTAPTAAELDFPAALARDVEPGQSASVRLHDGITAEGIVTHIGSPANGTVAVTVQVQATPAQFRGQEVLASIRLRTLHNVLYLGRPVAAAANSEVSVFKLQADGNSATRVKVRLGAASVTQVQVLDGLKPGDRVILSDMSKYAGYDRVLLE